MLFLTSGYFKVGVPLISMVRQQVMSFKRQEELHQSGGLLVFCCGMNYVLDFVIQKPTLATVLI